MESECNDSCAGQIQIRGEWNWARQNIKPLWNQQLGKIAGMLGAKNVGSAPWKIGDAIGVEAEINLPKKDGRRLWAGILTHNFVVLHFMVTHPIARRDQIEPEATQILSSLQFPEKIPGAAFTPEGLPIPPDFSKIDPQLILHDINDPENWHAFTGESDVGALQSFFLRELTQQQWQIDEYVPFSSLSELGFTRYKLHNEKHHIILGLLPPEKVDNINESGQLRIVYKTSQV